MSPFATECANHSLDPSAVLLVVSPLLALLYGAFLNASPGEPGTLSANAFVEAWSDPAAWSSALTSLGLAIARMLVVMPIVGRIYNHVSPRIVVAFGILLFAYTAWQMGHYTLATSARDIVNVLIIQGVAFSCLFIPLTTIALSSIPRHRLSDATGLNSLLRQTGGSVGLAVFATLMSRYATRARDAMLASVTLARPAVAARMAALQHALAARGVSAAAAQSTAARMIDGQLRQQAMVLSFERLFYLAGILFLCVLPLVFFLKMPPHAEAVKVHVEM